ncbi:ROK family transcriptional regulator [Komagataeibacter rhaeticus]|uniref:ROK family transcriptional regulator n=1 Tax=Komagataeibacter rhaeticus TaxID=215221 RepID=UPI0024913329|nr:ROK family transcriptional regulator [Komagataeibacter rhaeticus]
MSCRSHVQLLRLLNQCGPLSRAELIRMSGLSKGAVSMVTADLLARGLIETRDTVYGGGRPSTRLGIAADSAFFVGISLADRPVMVLGDLHGMILDRYDIELPGQVMEIGAHVRRLIARVAPEGSRQAQRLRGIGLAVSGLVDEQSGLCVRSTLTGWENAPVGPLVTQACGLPAYVENDANALTVAQYRFGPMREAASFSLISVGQGIGCGHMFGGELFRGFRGGAGEIAHATAEPGGLPCLCGKTGCLDTVASMAALSHLATRAGLPGDLEPLEQLAAQGNLGAVELLHRAGSALGLMIAQMVQIMDPQHVLVVREGGGLEGLFARAMRQAAEGNIMPQPAPRPRIMTHDVTADSWAFGAASVAADRSLFREF